MPARCLVLMIVIGAAAFAQDLGAQAAARLDAQGKCHESEAFYQQALKQTNQSDSLWNNAGNHYLVCGQPEKARSLFERLLRRNPRHQNANLQMARLAVDRKDGAEALTYLDRSGDAGLAAALLRAEAFHWAGKDPEALSLLASLSGKPNPGGGLPAAIGGVYLRMGKSNLAEAEFQAALERNPADFDALFGLGRAAARAGHYDRALRALESANRIRPGDAGVLTELGLANAASQDYNKAVYFLAQARQRAPERAEIGLALARAAEDAGYYGDAALAYDEYLGLRPGDTVARRDRARVLGHTGTRLEEGLREMAAYSRAHPNDPVGHYNLAQFSWRANPDQSLEQLAVALRLDPRFVPAHVSRAWLLHRLGRAEEAVPHLEAALAIETKNLRALDQLGLVLLALDRPAEAERALRRAFAVAPTDANVCLHLGRALIAQGRESEANGFLELHRTLRPAQSRDARREPGMIESATLAEPQRRLREIERFRRLASARPDDPLLQLNLAKLLLGDGRADEATAEFRRLLSQNAEPALWEQAGHLLVQARHYELAREFLLRAGPERPAVRLDLPIVAFHLEGPAAALQSIDAVPPLRQTADLRLLKARILDGQGQRSEAERLLAEGLGESELQPEIARQAAILLLRYKRPKDALNLLERALRANPEDSELSLARALALALSGQPAPANRAFREIASRWPEWDRIYLAQGLILERDRQPEEALRKLRTAVALGTHDAATACAMARLSGNAPPEPQCACRASLAEWLDPSSCLTVPPAR